MIIHPDAGYDGQLLSIAEAVQAVMPETPAPPAPACKGCKAKVGVQEVNPRLETLKPQSRVVHTLEPRLHPTYPIIPTALACKGCKAKVGVQEVNPT